MIGTLQDTGDGWHSSHYDEEVGTALTMTGVSSTVLTKVKVDVALPYIRGSVVKGLGTALDMMKDCKGPGHCPNYDKGTGWICSNSGTLIQSLIYGWHSYN